MAKFVLDIIRAPYGNPETPEDKREYCIKGHCPLPVGFLDEIKDFVRANVPGATHIKINDPINEDYREVEL